MIDLMENKVLAPLILQKQKKGRDEGLQQGVQRSRQGLLGELLTEKFGTDGRSGFCTPLRWKRRWLRRESNRA